MAAPKRPNLTKPYTLTFDDGSTVEMPASKYSPECEPLEWIIHLGVYEYLLNMVRVCRLRGMGDGELVNEITNLFKPYIHTIITEDHLEAWLKSNYPEFKQAYFFNMDSAVGHLYNVAIHIAEKADAKSGQYVLDLINKIESTNSTNIKSSKDGEGDSVSKQTASTVSRIFQEAKRFIK